MITKQHTHHTIIVHLLSLIIILTACQPAGSNPPASEQTTITVSGAFALFPMMTIWTEAYAQVQPQVRFDVQAGGAGKGMTDMLTGAADIAMLSRDARPEEIAQGAFLVPVTIDAVIATINANNPYLASVQTHGLTPEDARAIWVSSTTATWGQLLSTAASDTINVYTRADASGAAEMWALYAQGEAQEDLTGTAVNGDPGLAEAVRQDTLGIGFNNIGFAYDPITHLPISGLEIIPLDLNANGQIDPDENFYATRDDLITAIAAERYPFPPARVLYLVTRGTPSPAIADFYRWVLTAGQAYVTDAGYVPLTDARIQDALAQLID